MNVENKVERQHSTSDEKLEWRISVLVGLFKTLEEAHKVAGLSIGQLKRYKAMTSEPSFRPIVLMAMDRGVSLDWLATGKGAMMLSDKHQVADESSKYGQSDAYSYIPLFDVDASAGYGRLTESEHIRGHLAFRKQFIKQELGSAEKDLALLTVTGDSMEPSLKSGDTIMIDQGKVAHIAQDGLYVLQMDGSLLVKRLQTLPGDRVRVSSDNPAYQPFEMSKAELISDLVGRVVWTGRKF